jgi:aminoglycoside phosphotransferase (APT) family kinase protein
MISSPFADRSASSEKCELALRYAARTGRNLDQLDYYSGFTRWKSAAILHGVYARYMAGKKSTDGVDLEELRNRIDAALTEAEHTVKRMG